MSQVIQWLDELPRKSKRPAIRPMVMRIPQLDRIEGGPGFRYEVKFDWSPDSLSLSGLKANHAQSDAREYFYFEDPTATHNASSFLNEMVMRGIREIRRYQ